MGWLDKFTKSSGSTSKPKGSAKSSRWNIFRSKTKLKQPESTVSEPGTPVPGDDTAPNPTEASTPVLDQSTPEVGETSAGGRDQRNEGDSAKTVVWNTFRTVLDVANQATANLPPVGLGAAIGGLVAVIKTFEVRRGLAILSQTNLISKIGCGRQSG